MTELDYDTILNEINLHRHFRPQLVLDLCNNFLDKFPGNLLFLVYKAEALIQLKEKERGYRLFQFITKQLPTKKEEFFAIGKAWDHLSFYHLAFPFIKYSSYQGFAQAQTFYGTLLDFGEGCDKDPNEAEKWFLASAKQGNIIGIFNMGQNYQFSVNRDYEIAIDWYLKAPNYLKAEHNLGICYLNLPNPNIELGFKYLLKSADNGNGESCLRLSYIYNKGIYTSVDVKKALHYAKQALLKGEKFVNIDINLRSIKEVAKIAVQMEGLNLGTLNQELMSDIEIVYEAIKSDKNAKNFVKEISILFQKKIYFHLNNMYMKLSENQSYYKDVYFVFLNDQ